MELRPLFIISLLLLGLTTVRAQSQSVTSMKATYNISLVQVETYSSRRVNLLCGELNDFFASMRREDSYCKGFTRFVKCMLRVEGVAYVDLTQHDLQGWKNAVTRLLTENNLDCIMDVPQLIVSVKSEGTGYTNDSPRSVTKVGVLTALISIVNCYILITNNTR